MNQPLRVYPTSASQEYFSDEGCHILEILNDPSTPAISLARARVEVGGKTRLHALSDTIELYYILQGHGLVYIGGDSREISTGDCVKIEKGVDQRIDNIGDEDLVFLCICHPRFQESNYRDTEE